MRHSLRLPTLLLACLGLVWLVSTASAQSGNSKTSRSEPLGPEAPKQGSATAGKLGGTVRNTPAVPKPPFPPLSPEHQKYLDDILTYWEQSSSKIERYTCKFRRWEYDHVFGPKDRATYKTYSTGEIKYAAPDKGLFKVEEILHYTLPETKDGKATYKAKKGDFGEKWICDGQSVFEFDHLNKKLVERQLPPDMRGKAIADGPLPFLFGAKADKIKERYWVQVVTPSDAKGEYWLEAYPKTRGDAANFKKVEIIIDEKDFLPKAIQVYSLEYDERTNRSRHVFMFGDRKTNGFILDPLQIFFKDFYRPKTPSGWEKIVEKYPVEEPAPPAGPKASQAQRPTGKTPPK